MTHAIVAQQAGGPEVLAYTEVERPEPGPGQLLVKVAAAGVNFIDTYKRGGVYKVPYPFIPGGEAAGTVEAVGDGVTAFAAVFGITPCSSAVRHASSFPSAPAHVRLTIASPLFAGSSAISASSSIADFPPNSGSISGCAIDAVPSYDRPSPHASK